MSTKNVSLQSIGRIGGLALLAAVAIGGAQPTAAVAASVDAPSVSSAVALTSSDIGAARRHRQARRSSPRDAYGSYVGGASGVASPSYPSYGYGVGDNSHGQTW
jgi:hypothetical protein